MLDQAVDAKEAFERDGFLMFDPEIPERTIDRAVADAEFGRPGRLLRWRRRYPPPDPGRVTDAWAFSQSVKAVALAPAVLRVLMILYGREPRPFQTLDFKVGTQQKAHADAVHFNTEPPGFMCGVWVAMEDIGMDCGPLVYHPRSHKLPYVSPQDVGIEVAPGQAAPSHDNTRLATSPISSN